MGKFIDFRGVKIGRLTPIEPVGRDKQGYVMWRCKCDCGNEKIVTTKNLGKGTSSCGCYARELKIERDTKHGMSRTRLYRVHRTMMSRCENPNAHEHHNYGGRGIKVCEEWKNFENFARWALANGYEEAEQGTCTLDRIDVNGDYEPSNCRWVTMKTQQRNRRNNRLITFNGETHCVTEWAEIIGLKAVTLQHRLQAGWSVERALTAPVMYTR